MNRLPSPATPEEQDAAAARAKSRAAWSDGHYPSIAERLLPASVALAEAAQAFGGDRVLDVGTGSGNTAIALAQRGADVVGIDHTDAWFDDARRMAAEAGVEVELLQADAEDLPFEDGTFDVVASCFAHMFTPNHDVVAAEMARVLRIGGTLAVAVWDKRGEPAFDGCRKWLPSPPEDADVATDWGDADYLRAKFRPVGIKIDQVDLHDLVWEFGSRDALVQWLFTSSGPWMATKKTLQAAGVWDEALRELEAAIDEHHVREDGTCARHLRYLIALGTRIG